MKKISIILFVGFFIPLTSCDFLTRSGDNNLSISFKEYGNYSYSGPSSDHDSTFFYYTSNKQSFDSLFYHISTYQQHDTIPDEALKTKQVAAIVKYSNDYYKINVDGVSLDDKTLIIKYSSTETRSNMRWVAAISHLVLFNANADAIRFIENGTEVKTLMLN